MEQSVSWKFRLSKAARYKVVIKYIAGETSGGEYELLTGGVNLAGTNKVKNGTATEVITETMTDLSFSSGEHVLTIKPLKIQKSELMKLLEIQLILIDK